MRWEHDLGVIVASALSPSSSVMAQIETALCGLLLVLTALSNIKICGGSEPRVVIVGAGVSGLGAAVRLLDHGFQNLKILEAENRIGGRVHSVKMGNWTVDRGAHWVHGGPGNPVYELAAPLGLVEESGDGDNVTILFSDGKALNGSYQDYHPDLGDLTHLRNVSLYDVLYNRTMLEVSEAIKDKQQAEAFAQQVMKMECTLEGCDSLRDVSASLGEDYRFLNSSQTFGWKGRGYGSILDLVLRQHEKSKGPAVQLDDKLSLNKEARKIRVEENEVVVECSDGTEEKADIVLVTVSVGVLKAGLDSLFHPPLSQEKRAAIDAIGLGTVDKVILRFSTAWWPELINAIVIVWLPSDLAAYSGETEWEKDLMVFARERWSPYTLTTWLIGDAARQMERTPLAEVQAACMRVLRHFLGRTYTIPEPVEVIRTNWGTNPHFRGSYSYRRLQAETVNITKIAEPLSNSAGKQVVFFAGEATHPHFFSTVHGALESGWREADTINALYKSQQ